MQVFVNFGQQTAPADSNWFGTDSTSYGEKTGGVGLPDADDGGNASGVLFFLTDGADYFHATGVNAVGSGDAAFVDEAVISNEAMRLNSTNDTAQYYFGGLDQAKTYEFVLFGSTVVSGTTAILSVTAEGQSAQTLDTSNNSSNVARFTGVSPNGDGRIYVTIQRDAASTENEVNFNAAYLLEEAQPNQDPVLDTPISDITFSAGVADSEDVSGNFSDANSDPLTYGISPALPSGLSLNTSTGVITADGTQVVTAAADYTITADDGNGGTPASDVVSIEVVDATFTVTSVSAGPYYEGTQVTLGLANDSGSGMVLSSDAGTLAEDSQSSGSLVFTIPNLRTFGDRRHTYNSNITFTVTDGANSDTFTLSVTPTAGFEQGTVADPNAGFWTRPGFTGVVAGDIYYVQSRTDADFPYGTVAQEATDVVFDLWLMDVSDAVPVWSDPQFTLTIPGLAPNNAPTGSVVISGSAAEGQTLTADTSAIADADGLGAFSYQWLADGSPISGATGSAYTLTSDEVGSTITVQVSYTDGEGNAESVTSAATSAVTSLPRNFVIDSGNAFVDRDGVLVNATIPIWELWTNAPEEDGATKVDFGTNLSMVNGVASVPVSGGEFNTTYLLVLRSTGLVPTTYGRISGQLTP